MNTSFVHQPTLKHLIRNAMCISLVLYDSHPALLLMLAFNRDEFWDRSVVSVLLQWCCMYGACDYALCVRSSCVCVVDRPTQAYADAAHATPSPS